MDEHETPNADMPIANNTMRSRITDMGTSPGYLIEHKNAADLSLQDAIAHTKTKTDFFLIAERVISTSQ